ILRLLVTVLNKEPDHVIWLRVYDVVESKHPITQVTPVTPIKQSTISTQTPSTRNTGSSVNSSENRRYMDDVIRGEIESIISDVPEFEVKYFQNIENFNSLVDTVLEKCQAESETIQLNGWEGWPTSAIQSGVVRFLEGINERFWAFVPESSRTRARVLVARPNKGQQGSTAIRKVDIAFVQGNDPKHVDHSWLKVHVPGELKSNIQEDIPTRRSAAWVDLARYVREIFIAQQSRRFVLGFTLCGSIMRLWEFDRSGVIGSTEFDINKEHRRFITVMLGFQLMSEVDMGFDPTIKHKDDSSEHTYIEIKRKGQTETLRLGKCIRRTACIVGRATTCWEAYPNDNSLASPLVIKDSWQYCERVEEGEMLEKAAMANVKNVATYYHHETVQVGATDDDVVSNVRKNLDTMECNCNWFPRSDLFKLDSTSIAESDASRKRKWSKTATVHNRVHRRVILQDYGQEIYNAKTPTALLSAIKDCIEGYESLYNEASLIHRDISINNLMIHGSTGKGFIIDLDLAIDRDRAAPSGSRGRTGTSAFMAIAVLRNEEHTFIHDLESFFWVLFWICIHYTGPGKEHARIVQAFEKWNYMDMIELAEVKKGIVSDKSDFTDGLHREFSTYYRSLIPCVDELRDVVFPAGTRNRHESMVLFGSMKGVLERALRDL
ncbi:hypothetical protein M501DRAFT_902888, partial [Patellaria atrata CBS 101060]